MLKEFKAFAMRGNVVDMAVGIIIGTAFGKIITSLVDNIIMPPIGFLIGRIDFSSLVLTLQQKTATEPGVVIGYGTFINTVINFLIVAFAMFIVIKKLNPFAQKPKDPVVKECPYCCTTIAKHAAHIARRLLAKD